MESQTDNSPFLPPNKDEEQQLEELHKLFQDSDEGCLDNARLLTYLRFRKGNVPEAYQSIKKMMCAVKEGKHVRVKDCEVLLRRNWYAPLKQRDEMGRQVLLWSLGKWNPEENTCLEAFRAVGFVSILISERRLTQENGIVLIVDCEGFGALQLFACAKTALATFIATEGNSPERIQETHVINAPRIFNLIFPTLVKPFLRAKAKERLAVHWDTNSLLKKVSRTILPERMGGCLPDGDYLEPNYIEKILHQEGRLNRILA